MARPSSPSGRRGVSSHLATDESPRTRAAVDESPRARAGAAETAAWEGMTQAPEMILDVSALRAALDAAVALSDDLGDRRAAAVRVMGAAHAEARAGIAAAIEIG